MYELFDIVDNGIFYKKIDGKNHFVLRNLIGKHKRLS